MSNVFRVEKQIGESLLSIETGKIAKQAGGAVVVTCGETMVLVAATSAQARQDIDYFPLSVDYREKLSAAGKFPGGFMKREGRPTTKEILTARMIDRPIRPLFPDGYFEEVQIVVTVLSADQQNDPDILAIIGASAALSISDIPFKGPIGAVRMARVDGNFVANPTHEQRQKSDYNLVLTGLADAINMIEVDAKQVSEDVAAEGIKTAQESIQQTCDLINELVAKCGKEKVVPTDELDQSIADEIEAKYADEYLPAFDIKIKADRSAAIKEVTEKIAEIYCVPADGQEEARCSKGVFNRIVDKIQEKIVRKQALEGKRLDGRNFDELRQISCEVGLLPRSHGSALFTRGETQALVSVTLGTGRDEQIVDGLLEEYGQKFMLHYNFPPYSVGEVRFIRGPGRREIGHGVLAEKALEQARPSLEDFPYTVKIVSDITESNGSSSMATVCGGTLALLDAGVPLVNPVAGISIGLVQEGDKHVLLTDIIGDEDHFGDMDFKVAGTKDGITAIQLDIKSDSISHEVVIGALAAAKKARMELLEKIAETIPAPRTQLSDYAPKLTSIEINPELIGKIIGPGGKVIKGIQEQTGAVIEIEDTGMVLISCVGGQGHLEARKIIEQMTELPKAGKIYKDAKVVSVKDFGAFVEILPGVEGLCHVSELSDSFVKNVADVCKVGDIFDVKLLLIDDQGRLKLSRKAAIIEAKKSEAAPKEE